MRRNLARFIAVGLLLLCASSCDSVDSLIDQAKSLLGLTEPAASKAKTGEDSASQAQADFELIGEMYRVVFARDTLSTSEREGVAQLASTLNQGASLEGLYNGLTHSADYRQLESEHHGATPEALSAFCSLLAQLEADLPAPTAFDATAAQPLAAPVEPSYRRIDPNDADDGRAPGPSPSPVDPVTLARGYASTFAGASFFTLKRVAGDEALKLVSSRAATPEKLALWYSKWAVQTAGLGVDFGLALRNSTDENFHYKWALSMPEDRVKWEVLNRVHRILNHGAKR